jgi:SsrA-binding protein
MTREHAHRYAAQNRRARFDYFIIEEMEAGIMLTGSEVKSLRAGRASISETYAGEMNGEIFLFNANIPVYEQANQFNHEPKRPAKIVAPQATSQQTDWRDSTQRYDIGRFVDLL